MKLLTASCKRRQVEVGKVFPVCFRYFDTVTLYKFEFCNIPPQETRTLGYLEKWGNWETVLGKGRFVSGRQVHMLLLLR